MYTSFKDSLKVTPLPWPETQHCIPYINIYTLDLFCKSYGASAINQIQIEIISLPIRDYLISFSLPPPKKHIKSPASLFHDKANHTVKSSKPSNSIPDHTHRPTTQSRVHQPHNFTYVSSKTDCYMYSFYLESATSFKGTF